MLDRPARGWSDLATRPLGPSRGWAPAWRMALRDLRRHPGRTAAAVVMILVPVVLASAFAVFLLTSDVSQRESDLVRLASAEALVSTDGAGDRAWTRAQVEARVGVPLVEVLQGDVLVDGLVDGGGSPVLASTLVTDLSDPVTEGLVDVLSGRLPEGADEVALTPALAQRLGVQVDDRVQVDGAARQVVGTAVERWGDAGAMLLLGSPDAVGGTVLPSATTWLAPSATDLDRSQDGTDGLLVLERQDLDYAEYSFGLSTLGGGFLVVLGVGLALVVLEIALLAGPAFAVGVRQQQRTLALLAATGGDERALRRVVLAQALAVGAGSAVLGAALGTVGGSLAMRLLRYRAGFPVGPVEVPWGIVSGFVVVGVVAALASALVPAITASRATVVAGLAPRPSARRLPWRRPLAGAALLVAGTLLLRAVTEGFAEATTGAAVSVLMLGVGMVLVVPLAVALLGRATTRLPLGVRLAGRESTRAAGRSVAAVAAVAGASAGLVAALTLTAAATEAERTRYVPVAAPGVSLVYTDTAAEEVESLARELLPGARTGLTGGSALFSTLEVEDSDDTSRFVDLQLPTPGCTDWADPTTSCGFDWAGPGNPFGSDFETTDVVGAELAGLGLDAQQVAVLEAGGLLLPEDSPTTTDAGSVEAVTVSRYADGTVDVTERASVPVGRWAPSDDQPVALLSEGAARELGAWFPSRVLVQPAEQVASPPTRADLDDPAVRQTLLDAAAPLEQALERDRTLRASVTTEVGPTGSFGLFDAVVVVLAFVVLLGATFTATALALADARTDRVVMTAVGAPPATQRSVAGATAALIAGTGALVGGLVGLVPGILVARALLEPSVVSYGLGVTDGVEASPVPVLLLVPWGWLALLVLGLPLLAGLVVAAVAPGRPDAEVTSAGRAS